ncbi:MAG: hypothetical protein BAJALOKI2v1_90052 [Promethearchaeota archaeon]|nr:MAG: hypothetical protein BAJALOKI2v1_90052 [Candidatus Lokiarchaeota archaeon]
MNAMKKLKIYSKTDYPRRLNLQVDPIGGGKLSLLNKEMMGRGFYKKSSFKLRDYGPELNGYSGNLTPLVKDIEKKIEENINREYEVKNLSLLSLIEIVLIETMKRSIPIDLLKIEILLRLFKQEDMFYNKGVLMVQFFEAESIYKACDFFSALQQYLYDIAKMLITEYGHDFLINKKLKGELSLSKTYSYDEKYSYFGDVKFYFLDESIYASFRSIFKEKLDLIKR